MRFLFIIIFLFSSGEILADNILGCDCQQIIGTCSASISVKPTKSESGLLYGAELKIQSSEATCSKVEYYIDHTPTFNILSHTNFDTDSVWGQKLITKDNISDISCKVCKEKGNDHDAPSSKENGRDVSKISNMSGSWIGSGSNCPSAAGWWGSGGDPLNHEISLSVNGNNITGSFSYSSGSAGSGSGSLSGSVNGNTANITGSFGETHNMSLSSEGSILTDNWCNKDGGCSTCIMSRKQ